MNATGSRIFGAAVLAVALTAPGMARAAEPVSVGGLAVPPPDGQCPLDAKYPSDRRLMEVLTRAYAGYLVAAFADCRVLEAWRMGYMYYLDHWSVVWRGPGPPPEEAAAYGDPARYCTLPPGAADEEAAQAAVRGLLEEVLETMNADALRGPAGALGTLGFDTAACYEANIGIDHGEGGFPRSILGVLATSVVDGEGVFATLYEATDDPEALMPLYERTRAWRNAWRRGG